jgi:aspartate/methionine/tyrosine aminotransferase
MSYVAQQMIGQPMFQVIDRVKIMEDAGRDVVHLEIGEPDFETPENISVAAVEAIQAGDTHYVSSWGVREFREACARATQRSRGFLPDLEQVLVTPGANIATF